MAGREKFSKKDWMLGSVIFISTSLFLNASTRGSYLSLKLLTSMLVICTTAIFC